MSTIQNKKEIKLNMFHQDLVILHVDHLPRREIWVTRSGETSAARPSNISAGVSEILFIISFLFTEDCQRAKTEDHYKQGSSHAQLIGCEASDTIFIEELCPTAPLNRGYKNTTHPIKVTTFCCFISTTVKVFKPLWSKEVEYWCFSSR